MIEDEAEQREYNQITVSLLQLLERATAYFFQKEVSFDDILFYETARERTTPKEERTYSDQFENAQTRHIGWELNLKHAKVQAVINFALKWKVSKPDGSESSLYTSEFSLQKGWVNSWCTDSWGFKEYSKWEPGAYTIEMYIERKLVQKGSFLIVE